jgi:uncharacterized repeat protein (TIGR01451 family)
VKTGNGPGVAGSLVLAVIALPPAPVGAVRNRPDAPLTLGHEAQLLAPDAEAFDIFGVSVSVSGSTVAVGASADDTPGGLGAGSVYVFVRSGTTWSLQQHLLAPDGAPGDTFGGSVSLSGDTLLIGAPAKNTAGGITAGAAYVFVRAGTSWTLQQQLLASDGQGFDNFGVSVSLSGDTAVVGSRLDDNAGGTNAGSAYVFVRSGAAWTEQQKLLAPDAASNDSFGWSVSVSGDTAVIGAMEDDHAGGSNAGSAYVFARAGTTWSLEQKLIASDAAANDEFGYSVSIYGDTVVCGAPGPFITINGWAYVFVRAGTTWTQQQKLVASDGAPSDQFGQDVAAAGDTVVIGAYRDNTPGGEDAGSAYVFVRSGSSWSEQQKLLAPDGAAFDRFAIAVSIVGGTVVVGVPFDATPAGDGAGSAHVFRDPAPVADLGVTKTDGQPSAVPGEPLTYTIVAGNVGPDDAPGATVGDAFPAVLTGVTWTCVAAGGATCTPAGSGPINDTVDLPVGGTAHYTATGTVSPAATGTLSNTVTVSPPVGMTDPYAANNSATDTDSLAPEADMTVTKTDAPDPVLPGGSLTYGVSIVNSGPSDAMMVTLVDGLPAGVTFVSSSPGPPTCVLAGPTLTCGLGAMAAGGSVPVTIDVTVNAPAGFIVNTATVTAAEPDPQPADNAATATTLVGIGAGELAHGTRALHDLAALPGPAADEDLFRISQKPRTSYEVVVDATSGDIGAGAGPLLQRMGPDGTTVVQTSTAIGTGSSRSLRWANLTTAVVEDQGVRVRSAECGTDCGPDDVYWIRAYETTYAAPRFNNADSQVTVLLLQNPTDDPIAGEIYFANVAGAVVAVQAFLLAPRRTLVLNTATVPGADNVGGAITIAHDGRYGDLAGKTVALEPATGFSFDTPLEPRRR